MCSCCLTNENEAIAGFILVMKTNIYALVIVMFGCQLTTVHAQSKHGSSLNECLSHEHAA
jgi:hypothetical protein